MHVQVKHSLVIPTLAGINNNLPKYGLNFVDMLENIRLIHAFGYGCMLEVTVASADWWMIAIVCTYIRTCFLPFTAIPTS